MRCLTGRWLDRRIAWFNRRIDNFNSFGRREWNSVYGGERIDWLHHSLVQQLERPGTRVYKK